jgi:hypothetical protein
MTTRDRILLLGVLAIATLGGFWFFALSPKRDDAKALDARLATAQQRLQTAQAAAASAANAKQKYQHDYATVARLGQAVPADDDTATLLYQLDAAANGAKVDLRNFALGSTGATTSSNSTPAPAAGSGTSGTASAATQAAVSSLPPGASVGTAGFPTMPFKLEFKGSFAQMEHLIRTVQAFVRVNGDTVSVKGRLLTIDGVALTPQTFPQVKATISATAFVLPESSTATTGSTGGTSTGAAPAGQSASTSTTSTAVGVSP